MALQEAYDFTRPASRSSVRHDSQERRILASYLRELRQRRRTESQLRQALAGYEGQRCRNDDLIQELQILNKETDHRLLNSLQMVASLLWMQSRTSTDTKAASQLAMAAQRVTAIGCVHRRLHYFDGIAVVPVTQFLREICRDLSAMLSRDNRPEQIIAVEGIEIELPSVTAIPLGLIVNELVTNAAKYSNSQITVRLEPNSERGYAISVSNDGPALPNEFDPAASKGLGMKIIRSLMERIDGELRFGRADKNQGACFTVLFS